MTLASGTVLANRYRVLARLGEGGMGSVYQVEDLKRPGVVYALKALLDDTNTSPEDMAWAAKRFDEEITLLSRLSHPRIPAFVDRFTEGGRRYFVMEYIPGMTLQDRLDEKGLLTSRSGAASPERGGHPRRFFSVTAAGLRAVKQSLAVLERMRAGLDPVLGVR